MTNASPLPETVKNTPLLPCPFCGSSNVDAEGWTSLRKFRGTEHWRSGPACDDCSGSAQSVELWNRRPHIEAMRKALDQIDVLSAVGHDSMSGYQNALIQIREIALAALKQSEGTQ